MTDFPIPDSIVAAIGETIMSMPQETVYVYLDGFGEPLATPFLPGWCEQWWEVDAAGDVKQGFVGYWQ